MSVLALGAHHDDVEIGCWGALVAHRELGQDIIIVIGTEGNDDPAGGREIRNAEARAAADLIGATVYFADRPDNAMVNDGKLLALLDRLVKAHVVGTIYTHSEKETHQDHLVMNLVGKQLARHGIDVLFYESPSTYDFCPRLFIDLEHRLKRKGEALMCHRSQLARKGAVDLQFFVKRTAAFRGMQSRKYRFAEAFEVWRMFAGEAPVL